MTRNLKALGLALMAVLALGAIAAGSASAAGERFHSEEKTTILTGTSEASHVFAASGFSVTCTEAHFRGTTIGDSGTTTSTTLSVHPIYTGCTSSLGAAPVDTNGCNYTFDSETNASKHLPISIFCTPSNVIKVTAPGCTLSFGSQNIVNGASVANLGAGTTRDVTVTATATATFSKSGFGCFVIGGTTGTYTGPTTVKGFKDNGTTGDLHTDSAIYHEGAQIGITWN
jgi:hypothetical protein